MPDVESVARFNVFIIFTQTHLISKTKEGKDISGAGTFMTIYEMQCSVYLDTGFKLHIIYGCVVHCTTIYHLFSIIFLSGERFF